MTTYQPRVPAGVRTGGRFSAVQRDEPLVTLADIPGVSPTAIEPDAPLPTRRRIALTPEQVAQRNARIHPVEASQLNPARAQAIREASDLGRWASRKRP